MKENVHDVFHLFLTFNGALLIEYSAQKLSKLKRRLHLENQGLILDIAVEAIR